MTAWVMGHDGIVSKRTVYRSLRKADAPSVRREAKQDGGGGAMAVKPEAEETFWQRFLATYCFRRGFGRESWWASFRGAIRAAWGDGPDQVGEGAR
jgi:hypothetical protein